MRRTGNEDFGGCLGIRHSLTTATAPRTAKDPAAHPDGAGPNWNAWYCRSLALREQEIRERTFIHSPWDAVSAAQAQISVSRSSGASLPKCPF